jgi:hypothetical protein
VSLDETSIKVRVNSANVTNLRNIQKTLEQIKKLDDKIDFSGLKDGIINIDWDKVTDNKFATMRSQLQNVISNVSTILSDIDIIKNATQNMQAFNQLENSIKSEIGGQFNDFILETYIPNMEVLTDKLDSILDEVLAVKSKFPRAFSRWRSPKDHSAELKRILKKIDQCKPDLTPITNDLQELRTFITQEIARNTVDPGTWTMMMRPIGLGIKRIQKTLAEFGKLDITPVEQKVDEIKGSITLLADGILALEESIGEMAAETFETGVELGAIGRIASALPPEKQGRVVREVMERTEEKVRRTQGMGPWASAPSTTERIIMEGDESLGEKLDKVGESIRKNMEKTREDLKSVVEGTAQKIIDENKKERTSMSNIIREGDEDF